MFEFPSDGHEKLLQHLNTDDALAGLPQFDNEISGDRMLVLLVPVFGIDEDIGVNEAWHDRAIPPGGCATSPPGIGHAPDGEAPSAGLLNNRAELQLTD